jgi:membrane protease YdiL (CAAX protease family)
VQNNRSLTVKSAFKISACILVISLVALVEMRILQTANLQGSIKIIFRIFSGLFSILSIGLLVGFTFYYAKKETGNPWKALGFKWPKLTKLISSLTLGCFTWLIAAGAYVSFLQKIGVDVANARPDLNRLGQVLGKSPIGMALLIFIVAVYGPLLEETLFRGFIYGAFKSSWGPFKANLASAGLFAFFHFVPLLTPVYFVVGVVLAYIREKDDSIISSILVHFSVNLFAAIALISAFKK